MYTKSIAKLIKKTKVIRNSTLKALYPSSALSPSFKCDEQNRTCNYATVAMPENKTRSFLKHAGNSATMLLSLICQLFQ